MGEQVSDSGLLEVGDDDSESCDRRRRTLVCWECNVMYAWISCDCCFVSILVERQTHQAMLTFSGHWLGMVVVEE